MCVDCCIQAYKELKGMDYFEKSPKDFMIGLYENIQNFQKEMGDEVSFTLRDTAKYFLINNGIRMPDENQFEEMVTQFYESFCFDEENS